jgi:phosphate transport system substrate-binding protein
MRRKTIAAVSLAVALAVLVTAVGAATASSKRANASLVGAGSSFVAPLVSKWIANVGNGLDVTYAPIGSGGGINAITGRTVDFGASDAPLTGDEFRACKGCVQIPWALSATSIPYHIEGVKARLHLTGPVVADIFLNKITKWNDSRIKKLNPKITLPALAITPVHRSDNSGTTFNFTDYLSRVSGAWRNGPGKGVAVNWPTGVGSKGSSGVAATLGQTNGAIAYVDVAYSLANHFTFAAVKNAAGKYQLPGLRGIAAAAASVKRLPADNSVSIVNPPKKAKLAYPISTFTWVIVPLQTSKAPELRSFIGWALTKGQTFGPRLIFQPLPKVVKAAAQRTLARIHT